MKDITLSDMKELLNQLEESVKSIEDPNLKLWSSGYLLKHKRRYINDLQVLSENFSEGRILELGSLPCHMTYLLHRLKLPTVSVDLNPERAKEYIERNQLQVQSGDIEQDKFPFDDSSFELLLLNETFEHLRINPLFTLREIKRVLKPGGRIIITTPNLYSLRNRWQYMTGKGLGDPVKAFQKLEVMGHMGHLREYSKNEMNRFAKVSGLTVIKHQYKSYGGSNTILKFIYAVFAKLRPYQLLVLTK